MSKKTISFGLSEKEIDRAIKELKDYKKELIKKINLLQQRVAERLSEYAQQGFNGAIVDDLVNDGTRYGQVKVSVDNRGDITVVVASGEDAVWIEFGAGVYHNGSVGDSPNPYGNQLGMNIGGYGKGNGRKETWGFYEDGELKLTHGTPATMPMAKAISRICDDIQEIVREVFG